MLRLDPERARGESAAAYEARVHALATPLFTPLGEGRLAWHAWGSARAQPLVLLHGGFGSWRHWILNVVPLSRRYRVLCADLPGLGDSDRLPGEYTADAIAAALLAGIDALLGPRERFDLCGFSFGGIVGSHLAARAGERARRFVAVAPGALGLPGKIPQLVSLGPRRDPRSLAEVHRENLGRLMIADPARIDDLALQLQSETVRRARARSGRIPWTDVARRALERCRCPIAGVWGAHDVIAEQHMDERRELFQRIQPGSPFVVIERAGHWVMYERPAAFNATLLDILAAPAARQ